MPPPAELPRKLGALDATSLLVGLVIGSGIFLLPNVVARALPSAPMILGVWMLAGVVSFFGALAFSELGAMMPATGGQYVFLREAYGPLWAFLYGWTTFVVIWTGGTAGIAVGFSIYLSYFAPLSPLAAKAASTALVAILTAVSYRGVRPGAVVQNIFTTLKMAGLAILIAGGLFSRQPAAADWSLGTAGFSWTGLGEAMIACLFAYEGWNAVSFVAGEIRAPQRNLPLGFSLGMIILVAVYLLANLAFLRTLSVSEIAAAERVGSASAERAFGPLGAGLVSLTILVSIIGSVNGCILSGPRVYFAQARDGLFFDAFTRIHPRFQTPSFSILAQGVLTALLTWTGSYELLISYSVFGSWVFYLLTVAGVVVLRRKYPDRARPYRMPGYPVTPFLFCAAALGFLINALVATPRASLMGLLLIAAGVPFYYLWRRHSARARSRESYG